MQAPHLILGLLLCSGPALAYQDVNQALLEWVDPESSSEGARERLVRSGTGQVPELFELASGQRRLVPMGTPSPVNGSVLVDRVAELFGEWEEQAVVEALELHLGAQPGADERLLAARMLGKFGGSQAFDSILRLCAPLPQAQLRHPRIGDVIREACVQVFERRPYAAHRVLDVQDQLPSAMLEIVARAAGDAPSEHSFKVLESFALHAPELQATTLEVLGNWPRWRVETVDGHSERLVAEFLRSDDVNLRKRAARALGDLDATRSVDSLLNCLDDDHRGVRAAARGSLSKLVGQDFGEDPERWIQWLDAEQDWWDARSAGALDAIADSNRAAAVQALKELSDHPVFKAETWDAVALLATNRDSAIAVAACGALARMDAAAAIPDLIAAAGNGRTRVATTASAALSQITRQSPPAAPGQWADLLK